MKEGKKEDGGGIDSTIKVTYNVNREVLRAWLHSITVNIAQLSFWNAQSKLTHCQFGTVC